MNLCSSDNHRTTAPLTPHNDRNDFFKHAHMIIVIIIINIIIIIIIIIIYIIKITLRGHRSVM